MAIDGSTELPSIILCGTDAEVDRFLVATLWTGEKPAPTISDVKAWADVLGKRGSIFASHCSACHYWLFEQLASQAGKPLTRPYPPM